MYLKSLTFKGFKSFVDRTVMNFEPGMTAVVGPNGSGKSNISDAVLWVLGERNAKNLRGQSMEDVIFSGSSARKAAGVAEVELVLDNSDGTLPVDFSEVSIGRRMYRNGESEYLINGSVVRRMDVLDILHDSGLGSGTNSIISQGALTSILDSHPEQHRELIEEAAGILKHKERRKKSERKLAQMDNHMARVNDITAEVERRLKPLERKAKKAITYKQLSAEYKKLRLDLAVDDLRILQKSWDAILNRESEAQKLANESRVLVDQAEKLHDDLQEKLQARGENESALGQDFDRVRDVSGGIAQQCSILRERRRSYEDELERGTRAFESDKQQFSQEEKALQQQIKDCAEAKEALDAAEHAYEAIEENYKNHVDQRNVMSKEIDAMMADQRTLSYRSDTIQITLNSMQEMLDEARVGFQVAHAQVADSQKRLEDQEKKCNNLQKQFDELENSLREADKVEQLAREASNSAMVKRAQTLEEMDEVRENLAQISAQRKAIEELERASEASNPVLSWLMSSQEGVKKWHALTHELSVPSDLDMIVEALLGSNMHGLFVEDRAAAKQFISNLEQSGEMGDVILLPEKNMAAVSSNEDFDAQESSHRLLDFIEVSPGFKHSFDVLLGRVFLYETKDDLFRVWDRAPVGVTLVSRDGCIVDANGRARFFRKSEEDRANSALLRRRNLKSLREDEAKLSIRFDEVKKLYDELENSLQDLRNASLTATEKTAVVRAQRETVSTELSAGQEMLESLRASHADLLEEQTRCQKLLDQTQPSSDKAKEDLASISAQIQKLKVSTDEMRERFDPVQKLVSELSDKKNDAYLKMTSLKQEFAYKERMVETGKLQLRNLEARSRASQDRFVVLRGASCRVAPLLKTLEDLSGLIHKRLSELEIKTNETKASSQELVTQIASASTKAREARNILDERTSAVASIRFEKATLEGKVKAAMEVITTECETPIETALELPEIEDRSACEAQSLRVGRSIKALGPVDPDAAIEYEEVNERYTYLRSQLQDMNTARNALASIVSLIDDRMKDEFIKTFEQVNTNFTEIFASLFPGGTAYLSLVNPDDLDNTGVDVNAQPAGKSLRKLSLLSGGEKSLTAMALLFAVYRIRQTPFYILDEPESALDDSNLVRLMNYLTKLRDKVQFIMITHQRRTMEAADVLYGVSMQADGITKVLSQRIDQARSQAQEAQEE